MERNGSAPAGLIPEERQELERRALVQAEAVLANARWTYLMALAGYNRLREEFGLDVVPEMAEAG